MSARLIRYTLDGIKLTHDISFGVTDAEGFDVYINRNKLDKDLDYDVVGTVEELREGNGKVALKAPHVASDVLLILSDTLARRVTNFAKAARFEESEIDNEFDNLLRLLEDATLYLTSTPYFNPVDIGLVDGQLPPVIAKGVLRVNEHKNGFELVELDKLPEFMEFVRQCTEQADRAKAEADKSAASASDAKNIADSIGLNPIGNYKGLWPDTGGSAKKEETWQTQVNGVETGLYFTALKDTAINPTGDNVNWRAIIGGTSISQYTDIVYRASGGNSAVENMIVGIPINAPVGSVVKTGATTWKIVNTSGVLLSSGLYAIPLTGLFISDFGFSTDNTASKNTEAWDDLISKITDSKAVTVKFGGGEFLVDEMSATDVNIKIKGEGKNGTILVNETTASVFKLTRTSIGNAYRNKLKILGITIGRDTLDGVHTASGDHGISITGYNNLEAGDIQINQAGKSGIYVENVYVMNFNDVAGGYCGQNNSAPPENEGVVRVNRISTGNSIRFRDGYISNSLKTDGLVINNAQSIKVGSSTFESCRNLIKIGTLGQTSRGVSIDTCYFENPSVRSISLTSCYGVLISCAYHNLVGPRSDEVFGCVRLESCDRVEIFGGSWGDPQSVSNPNYKGALELVCGGSMAFNGQVFISATASISKICVEKTDGNRLEFNIRSNRCGVEFESLKGLIKPKVGNVIPNTDLTAWGSSGSISVSADEFFDGSPMYNITGDGASSINLSASTPMSSGDEINFSGFISEACRLRIRGRRVSDNGFEDIANAAKLGDITGINVAGDYTRRFYVNGIATSDYNLINFIIQPTSSDTVTFAYPQSNLDLVPEDYK